MGEANKYYLYRGANCEKYQIDLGRLSPKSTEWGIYACCGNEFARCGSGIQCGQSAANSVVKHQWMQKGYPTAGVSTTPFFDRAVFYATHGGTVDGMVFVIDANRLEQENVRKYVVADVCPCPSVPDDQEVILVAEDYGDLPLAIVVEVRSVSVRNVEMKRTHIGAVQEEES